MGMSMKYLNAACFSVALLLAACDGGKSTDVSAKDGEKSSGPVIISALSESLPEQKERGSREGGGACGFEQPKPEGEAIFISGWSAISAKDGVLPETAFLGVKVGDKELFVPLSQQRRDDVAQYFHNPLMANSGFYAYVKKDQLKDVKTATLYQAFQGKVYVCDVSLNF